MSRRWFVGERIEADYVESIQVLKTDAPLALPPVRPLKARPAPKPTSSRVMRFKARLKAAPPGVGWNVPREDPDAHLGVVGTE